jgi:hypothetical protein
MSPQAPVRSASRPHGQILLPGVHINTIRERQDSRNRAAYWRDRHPTGYERSAGAEGRAGAAHPARRSATDLSADGVFLLVERPLLGPADVAMVYR